MSKELETIIGLEIHVQLNTKSGLFCGCSTDSEDAAPNTNVCPTCFGMLGALPTLNRAAVEKLISMGLAMDCEIAKHSKWDRKNYFYPDLPKGYQISQFDLPLCANGKVPLIQADGTSKVVRINRIHLEEDAAKNTHKGDFTLIDYNRSGVPLAEIVSEPDLRSVEEAKAYMQEVRRIVRYIGASDADMEKGHMRADASISMRPVGEDKLYARTEIKNLNSFRMVERALNYEIKTQTRLWEEGKPNTEESTALWDEEKQETRFMRDKEGSADYRYFPEPDIPEIEPPQELIDEIRGHLPKLPATRMQSYMKQGVSYDNALALIEDKDISDYYESLLALAKDDKSLTESVTKWFLGEFFAVLKTKELDEIDVTSNDFFTLVKAVHDGEITRNIGKDIFASLLEGNDLAAQLAKARDGATSIDLDVVVAKVIKESEDIVAQYKAGEQKVINVLVGKVMKETGGQAPAPKVLEALKKSL